MRRVVSFLTLGALVTVAAFASNGGGGGGGKGGGQGNGRTLHATNVNDGERAGERAGNRVDRRARKQVTKAASSKTTATSGGTVRPTTHRPDGTLYAADGQGGGTSNLYILNPASGAVIENVGPITDGVNSYAVTGLAVHPVTRLLYGVTGSGDANLITIDDATAQATLIGPLGIAGTTPNGSTSTNVPLADIEFDEFGTLYGWSKSYATYDLYTINIGTGAAAKVGESYMRGTYGNGLGMTNGRMYLTGYTRGPLLQINPATGVPLQTIIRRPDTPGRDGHYFGWQALTVNSSGQFYASLNVDGTNNESHLVRVDPVTGVTIDIGEMNTDLSNDSEEIDALAFDPATGILYAHTGDCANVNADNGQMYTVNPATAALTPVGTGTGIGVDLTGMAVHPTTGVMYGVTPNCNGNPRLVTINKATGAGTVIGELNILGTAPSGSTTERPLADIGFGPDGNLYGWAKGHQTADLYRVNLSTGQATQVGDSEIVGTSGNGMEYSTALGRFVVLGYPMGPILTVSTAGVVDQTILRDVPSGGGRLNKYYNTVNALTTNPSGVLYGAVKIEDGVSTIDHLMTLDPNTGVATDVGPTIDNIDAIAFAGALVGGDQTVPGIPTVSPYGLAALCAALALGALLLIRMKA